MTEEQRERIRINRERALELKRRKAEERAEALSVGGGGAVDDGGVVSPVGDHLKDGNGSASSAAVAKALSTPAKTRGKCDGKGGGDGGTLDDLEDWEVGASAHVTKEEAMRKYCLPQGTLAVCSYVEKPNPRNKGWTPMRLYERADIRRRARERFGGLEGLVEERRKRDRKRFANDMKETKDVFKRSKS